jgi:predicted transcriptional regulator
MATKPSIGRAELRILEYVADHQPITVAETAKHFAATAALARTTVLTVMEQLRRKGYLTRKKLKGVYHYAPKISKEKVLRTVVRDFVDGALGGSLTPFVAYLAEQTELSDAHLEELKTVVHQLDEKRKGQKP